MPTSLTATKIKDTYGQILHVDGGITSTPKLVYDGDGTATALKVSTTDVQVNNSPVLTDADLPSLATAAQGAKADTAVQPAAIANMLETSDIGVSVQAYDADLSTWSGKTAPSGTVVGTTDTQTLSSKTFSDNPVFSAGTANGVAYLNGSKVLTTGSALTFDGSSLQVSSNIITGRSGGADGNFVLKRASDGLTVGTLSVNSANSRLELATAYDPITFSNYLGEQMRLTGTGLGIGTSSPMGRLDVTGSNGKLILNNGNTAGGVKISAFNAAGNANGYLAFEGYSAEYARFDSSGNLGLGVTPSAWSSGGKLEIANGQFVSFAGPYGYISANTYYNGGFLYKTTGAASYYFQAAGQHQWHTAPSGTTGNAITFTQAMTLDASGNLGIGTSSPSQKLHVSRSDAQTQALFQSGQASSYVMIADSGSASTTGQGIGSVGDNLVLRTNSLERMRIDSSGNVGIGTSSPSAKLDVRSDAVDSIFWGKVDASVRGLASFSGSAVLLGSASVSPVAFTLNSIEKMRLDSSGNLLVGTTSQPVATYKQVIHYSAGSSTGGLMFNDTDSGTIYEACYFRKDGSQRGYIRVTTSGTSYNTVSDYRLKENVQPMQNALGVVAQLNPVTYTWKADGSDGQGFIAHELQAVVPDCVTGEKDAVDEEGKPVYQGIDTSFLVGILTKAIQELKAELDATKAEVASLKGN